MSQILSSINTWLKNVTRKKKFNYDYNSVFFKYADLGMYEEFCFSINNHIKVKSLSPLFQEINFSITTKDLKKVLKKPVSVIEIANDPKIIIYLYKKIEDNEKQKLLFHFFNGELVIISRVFPYASNHKILELQNVQQLEFGLKKLDEIKNNICYKDELNQCLFLLKDVEYTEHFMSPNPAFKSYIKSKFE